MQTGVYRHYKGGHYRFVMLAKDEKTGEDWVVYQSLQHGYQIWTRPRCEFEELVEVNGEKVPRFKRVSDVPAVLLHDADRALGGSRPTQKQLH